MTTSDKLREIAAKWKLTQADLEIWRAERRIVQTPIPEFLSDLNSLLEQHKEVILRDELEKFGTYFNEIRCPYVVTSVIDEYLKNVKKS